MKSTYVTLLMPILTTVVTFSPAAEARQEQANPLIALGVRQLEAASAANTEVAYQEAQATFAKVLAAEPDNPKALVHFGETKLMQAYLLALQAKYEPSTRLLQSGMADIDRAISLAPNRADLRLERGLSYGPMAAYINKSGVAREDLEIAIMDPQFQELPNEQRARAFQVLGIVYTNLKDTEKALGSFRASVEADRGSRFGKDAAERMKTLLSSGLRPDRFPKIPVDTSPLIAVVSITYENTKPDQLPADFDYTAKALANFPGLLAIHRVASVEKPGMFILFTWWKDKQALNDFYYSDLHEAWMNGRGERLTTPNGPATAPVVSQLGVEVFAQLPGGMQVHGGLIPQNLFGGQKR